MGALQQDLASRSRQRQAVDVRSPLGEYNQGVQEWSQAVQRLSEQAGAGHGTYMLFLSEVDEARVRTQRAKAAYAMHVEEHGC